MAPLRHGAITQGCQRLEAWVVATDTSRGGGPLRPMVPQGTRRGPPQAPDCDAGRCRGSPCARRRPPGDGRTAGGTDRQRSADEYAFSCMMMRYDLSRTSGPTRTRPDFRLPQACHRPGWGHTRVTDVTEVSPCANCGWQDDRVRRTSV